MRNACVNYLLSLFHISERFAGVDLTFVVTLIGHANWHVNISCLLFCVDLEKFRRSGFQKHKNATVGSYLVCINNYEK